MTRAEELVAELEKRVAKLEAQAEAKPAPAQPVDRWFLMTESGPLRGRDGLCVQYGTEEDAERAGASHPGWFADKYDQAVHDPKLSKVAQPAPKLRRLREAAQMASPSVRASIEESARRDFAEELDEATDKLKRKVAALTGELGKADSRIKELERYQRVSEKWLVGDWACG